MRALIASGTGRYADPWHPFAATGAIWIPTQSFHPPIGDTVVTGRPFPDDTAAPSFAVFDERYCRLQWLDRPAVVAEHPGDGRPEPAAWVRRHGRSAVAVDVLGHDERSYGPDAHRALVRKLADWAVTHRNTDTVPSPTLST